jgi:hypothetical protein
VALCLGSYGDPRGVGVSYERGTPEAPQDRGEREFSAEEHVRAHGRVSQSIRCTEGKVPQPQTLPLNRGLGWLHL